MFTIAIDIVVIVFIVNTIYRVSDVHDGQVSEDKLLNFMPRRGSTNDNAWKQSTVLNELCTAMLKSHSELPGKHIGVNKLMTINMFRVNKLINLNIFKANKLIFINMFRVNKLIIMNMFRVNKLININMFRV